MRQGAKPGGHGSRGTTARSSRSTLEMPRIATRWSDEVITHVLVPVVRSIRFPEHNAPGSFDAFSDHAIEIGNVVLEKFGAIGTAQTSTGFQVFNGDRQSMQWVQSLALHHGSFSRLRLLPGALGVYRYIGIETRIQGFNTG